MKIFFYITTIIITCSLILLGCSSESESASRVISSNTPGSGSEEPSIDITQTQKDSDVVSIEYQGDTLTKCKYLLDLKEESDLSGMPGFENFSGKNDQYSSSKFTQVPIYYPFRNPRLNLKNNKIKAQITLGISSYEGTNPGPQCQRNIIAGKAFDPRKKKGWSHLLVDDKKGLCYEVENYVEVTITNIFSKSCSVSFNEIHTLQE